MALWFILQAVAGKSWQQFWFKHHQATNHALHLLGFVDFLGHGAQVAQKYLGYCLHLGALKQTLYSFCCCGSTCGGTLVHSERPWLVNPLPRAIRVGAHWDLEFNGVFGISARPQPHEHKHLCIRGWRSLFICWPAFTVKWNLHLTVPT